jgi:hypothetical protein
MQQLSMISILLAGHIEKTRFMGHDGGQIMVPFLRSDELRWCDRYMYIEASGCLQVSGIHRFPALPIQNMLLYTPKPFEPTCPPTLARR